jgi:hypothetical protein
MILQAGSDQCRASGIRHTCWISSWIMALGKDSNSCPKCQTAEQISWDHSIPLLCTTIYLDQSERKRLSKDPKALNQISF